MIHETRVIPLDGRAHVDNSIRPYTGNGRGRFDGDTLVVETTDFTDQTGVGYGGNHSKELELVEAYRRIDPEMIEYTASVFNYAQQL